MVGRRFVGTSLITAALLFGGAALAQAQDGSRLVMVNGDAALIQTLETQGYDVGFVGEPTEAAVYLDAAQENLLRAQGFSIGEVIFDAEDAAARRAEINATTEGERIAAEVAKNGLSKAAKSKGAVNTPGHLVIQRAYTFSNYAGRFLYVEARNDLHTDTAGPAMSFTYTSPNGTSQVFNLSNSSISPDGNDAAIGGNKLSDGDAAAGSRYMYHRGLVALRNADANVQAGDVTVRVADAQGNFDTTGVTEWAKATLPPRVSTYQKDFITKYMDPDRDQHSPGSADGQQPEHHAGHRAAQQDGRLPASGHGGRGRFHRGQRRADRQRRGLRGLPRLQGDGPPGGNNITAEFKAPAAGTANAPLTVAVTDGTWRVHDQNDADASDGITETTIPTKDIVVTLGTNASGALSSTSAQVVAAINADPAASALVTASTYQANAGTGVVPATTARTYQVVDGTTGGPNFSSAKVKLSDYMRGGTAYWSGAFPTTANPAGSLVRTDARHVQKGLFNQKVYRITNAANRAEGKTGVFIYCEQHAREWVGGITCLETAQRLVTNYATDPTTKGYVDNLDIFILPVVNPDGTHASFYDNASQRRNLTNYCASTTRAPTSPAATLGRGPQPQQRDRVALRRLLRREPPRARATRSPARRRSPSRRSRTSTGSCDTFPKIKFAMNLHTHGGYFMWAPGAYKSQGRVTLPAPNIGIERYFFEVADDVLSHIRTTRDTTILPQRTGPIADVLYSAAGNSADDMYYRKGIIGYSFEAGAQRITVNPTTGAISRASVGFQPCFGPVGTGGGTGTCNASLVNEGHDEAMEFSEGNIGLIKGALDYANDTTAPKTTILVLRRSDERRADQLQVRLARRGSDHLLHDGRVQPGHRAGRSGHAAGG